MGNDQKMSGKAWLVGCGPGTLEHLTVSHRSTVLHSDLSAARVCKSDCAFKRSQWADMDHIGLIAFPSIWTHDVQLKAVRLIKDADVILYDDLGAEVSRALLGSALMNAFTRHACTFHHLDAPSASMYPAHLHNEMTSDARHETCLHRLHPKYSCLILCVHALSIELAGSSEGVCV